MNTFIEDKKKSHLFFFHKSLRKTVPISHIAATPLIKGFAGVYIGLLEAIWNCIIPGLTIFHRREKFFICANWSVYDLFDRFFNKFISTLIVV